MNLQSDARVSQIRQESDVFQKARLIKVFLQDAGVKIKDLAQALVVTSSYICHLLRLLTLPEIVVDGYYSGYLSLSHLFTISRLKDEDLLVSVYEECLAASWTVLELEAAVRENLYAIGGGGVRVTSAIKQKIADNYQKLDKDCRVQVVQTRVQAAVTVKIKGNWKKTSQLLEQMANRA